MLGVGDDVNPAHVQVLGPHARVTGCEAFGQFGLARIVETAHFFQLDADPFTGRDVRPQASGVDRGLLVAVAYGANGHTMFGGERDQISEVTVSSRPGFVQNHHGSGAFRGLDQLRADRLRPLPHPGLAASVERGKGHRLRSSTSGGGSDFGGGDPTGVGGVTENDDQLVL